ncbi:MAG: hypothetical protein D4R66_06970 [Opitutales bacterium]|nr:MAG: hypothetical protein D4R66_06970 [Opitutales bacterium]
MISRRTDATQSRPYLDTNAKGNRKPDDWLSPHSQVPGLGHRVSGSGVRVQVPGQTPVPEYPHPKSEARDQRPENVISAIAADQIAASSPADFID